MLRAILFFTLVFLVQFYLDGGVDRILHQKDLALYTESGFLQEEPSEGTARRYPERIPDYSGEDVIVLNQNIPNFTEYDLESIHGEQYLPLDGLGRAQAACAMLDNTMMPTQEREEIREIRPSGWHTVKYPELIEDLYLYNRCHLIAFCLTGQNAKVENLITGTRHMNVDGMLPYETMVARYLDDSNHHVLYRVTPYFRGNELLARGVEMEAYSVEDRGRDICFHMFVYNVQPGIEIDYRTGESRVGEK